MSESPEKGKNPLLISELQEREEPLTRSEVASYLHLSVSTVRRMEGRQLHPRVGERGVRYFDAAQVLELARAVAGDTDAAADAKGKGSGKRSAGELAAQVFERFERRESLAEIVVALRVSPKRVRALYHTWRVGLERGEQEWQQRPAVPLLRHNYHAQRMLADRLASLPEGESTRISFARRGEGFNSEAAGAVEPDAVFDVFDELGGFVADGPMDWSETELWYGEGYYRVTAYSLARRQLLWEIYVVLKGRIHPAYLP